MSENNALIVAEKLDVTTLFTDDGLQGILQDIESQAMTHVPDIETDQGRKDIASMAYKVTRSKTLIDKMGKEVVADWKKKAKKIDGYRKQARDFLDDLKEKVRQPLTDYEAEQQKLKEEEERKEKEKIDQRQTAICRYNPHIPYMEIALATDEEFDAMLQKAKSDWEAEEKRVAEQEAERKAEEERLAKQKAEQDAKEAELKKQADELAAKEREEREKFETEQRKLAEEKGAFEAEKRAEQEAKERAEREAREVKERAEREAKEKAEKEKREAEEKKRQKALLPDKEKLLLFADEIRNLTANNLDVKSEEARELFHITLHKIMEVEKNFRAAIEVL